MKKVLLLSLAVTTAISTFASAPSFLWGKLIDSPQTQDLSSKVVFTTDGNVVSLSQFGSRAATDTIGYDGVKIGTGAATTSNSDNLNLLVIKHNIADGSRMWSVSSSDGDFYVASYSNMIATADGGALVLVKGRSSDQATLSTPVIVDNSGAKIDFPDWNTSVRIYNQILIKINSDGNVVWARNIVMDQLPVPNATATGATESTTDGVSPYALAEDSEGNIYIGGNYRAPMFLTGDKNATYILTPRNISNYTGDVQSAAGGLYVIRLDKDGNYLNHLRASGDEITRDQANLFYIDGKNLYIAGTLKGSTGKEFTIGKQSIKLVNENDGFYVAKVSTDLTTVSYINQVKAYDKSSKQNTKLRDLQIINDKIYVVGGATGGYGAAGSTEAAISTKSTLDEGWFVVLNETDGSWVGGAFDETNIGAYLNVFTDNDKIYFYGYRLNKADGSFIDEYEDGKYTLTDRYTVAKGGGAPTGYSAAFNAKTKAVVTLTRGNAAFTYGNDATSAAPTSWGGLIAAYTFADTSAAPTIAQDDNTLSVKGANGQIVITTTEDKDVVISNLAGQVVGKLTAKVGESVYPISAGFYLVNNQKVIVR
jgi:hypothetical protein